MQRYVARIIRAVIVSLLGFGGGVGLMVFIVTLVLTGSQKAVHYGLTSGLWIGGAFALFLVGVLLPLDLTAKLFLAKGQYKEIWELQQARELLFHGSMKRAIIHCRQALLAIPAVQSVGEDLENLVLRAAVGPSLRSPGEAVEVELDLKTETECLLRCTSRSLSNTVVFDYGKNFENVESWLAEMKLLDSEDRTSA